MVQVPRDSTGAGTVELGCELPKDSCDSGNPAGTGGVDEGCKIMRAGIIGVGGILTTLGLDLSLGIE